MQAHSVPPTRQPCCAACSARSSSALAQRTQLAGRRRQRQACRTFRRWRNVVARVNPVEISYSTLANPQRNHERLRAAIQQAFVSDDALGILAVRSVPGFTELRSTLLPLARELANLPADVLTEYEHPESNFSVGWSHGKEMLSEGRRDSNKGSFYATLSPLPAQHSVNHQAAFPSLCAPNMWPTREIPGFEAAVTDLGHLICTVAEQLLQVCATTLELDGSQQAGGVQPVGPAGVPVAAVAAPLGTRTCIKARLLHYFATQATMPQEWCAWHFDHGMITGLAPGMFFDSTGAAVDSPDPASGLYVRTRSGQEVRVQAAPDHMLFQMGQSLQVLSGGILHATEHCVKAPSCKTDVTRSSFAVFWQPNADEILQPHVVVAPTDVGVKFWSPGSTFGEFSELVVKKAYHGNEFV